METVMIAKITLAAAIALGASAALADDYPSTPEKQAYLRNPNAPVPTYTLPGQPLRAPAALIEGRNVGTQKNDGSWGSMFNEQKRFFDRSATDFNS
jgi:hypothetical protein